ncbi:MAG: methyltransferase domain-containing protein [Thermoguttaceae bacterium]
MNGAERLAPAPAEVRRLVRYGHLPAAAYDSPMPAGPFTQRQLQPEVMDRIDLAAEPHHQALRGLARINRISRTVSTLWPHLRQLAAELDHPLRVLDVACGGGDVAVGLWHAANRSGVAVEIRGVDRSPTALDHARQLARRMGADVAFDRVDTIEDALPAGCDAIVCCLFLHHLEDDQAMQLLAKMLRTGSQLLVVSDLRRCRTGYWLAHLACRVLSRSPVVRIDGPRSVAAAFREDELALLFRRAGLDGATLERTWPFRMLATWRRP